MKKLTLLLLIFFSSLAYGQQVPPQGINFQAVLFDEFGTPVPSLNENTTLNNQSAEATFTFYNFSSGLNYYSEIHSISTDEYGRFQVVLGRGIPLGSNTFQDIVWSDGNIFLDFEVALNGQSKRLVSSQELLSVPYAFLAEKAMVAQTAVDVDDADADPLNELQVLSVTGDSLTLSNGNTIKIPATNDADADPMNEIQVLSRSNDTIYLSSGGYAVLPPDQVNDADADPYNELQTITRSGTNITLSGNGGIITVFDGDYSSLTNTPSIPTNTSDLTNDSGFLTTEVDGSTTNELQVLSLSNDTIYLTSGGYVVLPAGFDGDYSSLTNTPSIPTNTSDLTNDSGFLTTEVDGSTTNELQVLSISNDTIFLSGGGLIKLPAAGSTTNGIDLQDVLSEGNNAFNMAVFNIKRQSIGQIALDTSAVLDVASTTQGFLPPRMTQAQRDAIHLPAAGLIVWCTDCGPGGELQVFNGTAYTNMLGGPAISEPFMNLTQLGADIDGEAAGDNSGAAVSLSSDGTRVAIGATGNDGNGIYAGHVRIYEYSSGSWTQLGADIDGEATDDVSGSSVSLSSDGTTVAIGAPFNDGNGNVAGHVRVYSICFDTIQQQPQSNTFYTVPGDAYFTVIHSDTTATYQWQENTGSGWSNLSDQGVYSGTATDSLILTGITASLNGYEYRCLVDACSMDTTNLATLTVVDNIGIGEVLTDVVVSPNPTSGILNIVLTSLSEYEVFNINGHRVAQGKTEGQIDITKLPAGSYQIIITNDDGRSTHTIQKI